MTLKKRSRSKRNLNATNFICIIFFEGSVTAEIYVDMLQTFFWPRVQDQDCYFQHDGAPPHYGHYVRQWLCENFPRKWIGRRGPIEWPARSPDLTPPDFFLWGS